MDGWRRSRGTKAERLKTTSPKATSLSSVTQKTERIVYQNHLLKIRPPRLLHDVYCRNPWVRRKACAVGQTNSRRERKGTFRSSSSAEVVAFGHSSSPKNNSDSRSSARTGEKFLSFRIIRFGCLRSATLPGNGDRASTCLGIGRRHPHDRLPVHPPLQTAPT